MMRQIGLFAVFLFFSLFANSQDLILTAEQDSINCRITQEDSVQVSFTYMSDSGIRDMTLDKSKVVTIERDYYSIAGVSTENIEKINTPVKKTAPQFHLSFSYAWSKLISPISDQIDPSLRAYLEELRTGRSYQFRAHIFINEDIGLGFVFSNFQTSNSGLGYIEDLQTGQIISGTISDKVRLNFFAPSVIGRLQLSETLYLNYTLAAGYLDYRNDAYVVVEPILFEGGTFGMLGDMSLDILISKNIALGFGLGFSTGALNNVDVTNGNVTNSMELPEPEGLTRFNFFGGIRFYGGY
jgi:hypothetical protein